MALTLTSHYLITIIFSKQLFNYNWFYYHRDLGHNPQQSIPYLSEHQGLNLKREILLQTKFPTILTNTDIKEHKLRD
jgi:hypothetical protein